MLIDSHCHVLKQEYNDVISVIKNTFSSGVDKIIVNGYDLETSKEAINLALKYENIYAAVGIGPENLDNISSDTYNEIEMLLKNKKVVAVGEIGLDYYWTKDTMIKQKEVFEKMLFLAKKYNKPVIVHSRKSIKDTYDLLKKYKVNGIMHCFSGSYESAKEFIKIGFLIGVGGIVTFKNAKKLVEVVEKIPLDKISLETDSPYLSPEPLIGAKNEPKNVIYVANKIADLKGVNVKEVIDVTGRSVVSKFDL